MPPPTHVECVPGHTGTSREEARPQAQGPPPPPEPGWPQESGHSAGSPSPSLAGGWGREGPVPSGSGSKGTRNVFSSQPGTTSFRPRRPDPRSGVWIGDRLGTGAGSSAKARGLCRRILSLGGWQAGGLRGFGRGRITTAASAGKRRAAPRVGGGARGVNSPRPAPARGPPPRAPAPSCARPQHVPASQRSRDAERRPARPPLQPGPLRGRLALTHLMFGAFQRKVLFDEDATCEQRDVRAVRTPSRQAGRGSRRPGGRRRRGSLRSKSDPA